MRNETILKKALHEVMTEKYSEELINMKAPDHEFSESFNIKMRNLIRKTDNPFYRYSKYLTLAACAVIAVGCAVLIPALNANKINTGNSPNEQIAETTEAIISTVPTEASEAISEEPVVSDDGVEEIAGKDPDSDAIPPLEEAETTDNVTSTSVSTPSGAPVIAGDSDEDETADTTKEYEPIDETAPVDDDNNNPGTGGADIDGEIPEIEEEEPEGDIVGEHDENPSGGEDYDEAVEDDGDEEIAVDDESDEDIAVEEEEEVVDEDVIDVPEIDDRPEYPEAETLGELYTKLYQQEANPQYIKENTYKIEDANYFNFKYDTFKHYDYYTDYDFVGEFLAEIGAAKKTELKSSLTDKAIVYLNPVETALTTRDYADLSDVNHYGAVYHGEEEYEEDCTDIEEEENPYSVKLEIYRNGLVCLTFDWNKGSLWFAVSAEIAGRFFENVDNMFMSEAPATVGDIISDRNITEDNISRAYGDIYNVYDYHIVGINLNGSKSVIVDFLKENKDKKLTYFDGYCHNSIEISFGLKDNSSVVNLRFVDFDKAVISVSDGDRYAFDIDKAQFNSLFKKLVGICGYKKPVVYNTLAEFIEDKEFNEITSVSYKLGSWYIVEGNEKAAVLEEIRQLILKEAKTAKYSIGDYVYSGISICVKNWQINFEISGDAAIRIHNNRFNVSQEFIDKLKKLITDNMVAIRYEDEGEVDPEEEWTEDIDEG